MRCIKCGANLLPEATQCRVCGADVVSLSRNRCGGDKVKKWKSMIVLVVLFVAFAGMGFGGSYVVKERITGLQNESETVAETETDAEQDSVIQDASSGSCADNAVFHEGDVISVRTPVKVRWSPDLSDSSIKKPFEISSDYRKQLDQYNEKNFGIAVMDKGTRVTVNEVFTDVIDGKKYIWINTDIGWMCAKEGSKEYLFRDSMN